jgi:ACS family hexuronate transporter-like MFS transporter
MADLGSIGGGWLSSWFLARGWSLNAARKTTMLVCAITVIPVFGAAVVGNYLLASVLVGLACAGHQGFSANLFTMASDTMPGKVVGSLVGLGGAAAAGLGFFVNAGVGWLLHLTHGKYEILFAVAASAYLVALLLIQLINPRWESAHEVAGEIKAPA